MATSEFEAGFDPYKVLGLARTPDPTPAQISAAYKKLVPQRHPDNKETGSTGAFEELRRAYDVLRDPVKKRSYDTAGQRVRRTAEKARGAAAPVTDPLLRRAEELMKGRPEAEREYTRSPYEQTRRRPGPTFDEDRLRRAAARDDAAPSRPAPVSGPAPRPTVTPFARPGDPPPGAGFPQLLEWAGPAARALLKVSGADIRDRDRIQLHDGAEYTFLRVQYGQPGTTARFRTPMPLLCRGDEVLADIKVLPGQRLRPAPRLDSLRDFVQDRDEITNAIRRLAAARERVHGKAAEICSIMSDDEKIGFNGKSIEPRRLTFEADGKTRTERVLCWGNEILELADGHPVDPGMRFADAQTCDLVQRSYRSLVDLARRQAEASGRHVPTNVRSVANKFDSWVSDFLG